MASRERRERAAQGLANHKAKLRQMRDTIENDQSYVDARQKMQADYGVDVVGKMIEGLDEAVALISWVEDYENLNVGPNKA